MARRPRRCRSLREREAGPVSFLQQHILSPGSSPCSASSWWRDSCVGEFHATARAFLFSKPLPRRCPARPRRCSPAPSRTEQSRPAPPRRSPSSDRAGFPEGSWSDGQVEAPRRQSLAPETETHSCFRMRDDTSWAVLLLELLGVAVRGGAGEFSWSASVLKSSERLSLCSRSAEQLWAGTHSTASVGSLVRLCSPGPPGVRALWRHTPA